MKLSFVTPVHAPAMPYVKRCVESMLNQKGDIEIIIVSNGPDNKKVNSELTGLYDKVKILFIDEANACKARNLGLENATGDIISFAGSDFVIHPGTVERWMEYFNKGYEVVYSGYRLITGDPRSVYMSEPFNRYTLTCYNYIDGGNPIIRAKCPQWDNNIISLQDWDFWLEAIKNIEDDKILFIPEPLFSAEPPKPGGLSLDSHNNWLERTKVIKEKHGIPDRKICISSQHKYDEAVALAQLIGADYKAVPSFKPHSYDMIYQYGFYVENVQDALSILNVFQGHNGAKLIHWQGDDLILFSKLPWYQVNELTRNNFSKIKHYHMSNEITKLLSDMHIDSKFKLPPQDNIKNCNGDFSVGISGSFVNLLKKALPDVNIVDRNKEAASIVLLPDGGPVDAFRTILSGGIPVMQQDFPYIQKMPSIKHSVFLRNILYKTVRDLQDKWPISMSEAQIFYNKLNNKQRFIQEVNSHVKRHKR